LPPVSDKYFSYFESNLKKSKALPSAESTTSSAPVAQAKRKNGLTELMKLFSVWLVFPLTFVFVLLDKGQIQQFFIGLVPNRYFELARTIADEVDTALGKYIRGTLIECALVGLTISLGLWICGFSPNIVILVGLIGGLTNAIPFVGPALAFLAGSAFALIAEAIDPLFPFITLDNLFVAVLIVVAVAQLLDNAIYQPLVVGGAVNLHPLVVILGVFSGSLAFGFAGLLLAIPVIVILKVVTETLYQGLKAYKII
jgi:predicted PurR-regulated permease PerM